MAGASSEVSFSRLSGNNYFSGPEYTVRHSEEQGPLAPPAASARPRRPLDQQLDGEIHDEHQDRVHFLHSKRNVSHGLAETLITGTASPRCV